ncbi:MAG: MoaD/ThiS family protein [Defluviitaleaceae bacterium]|nr:MoaD/ThiS family protein [Defluviitaleaceae bacterium]
MEVRLFATLRENRGKAVRVDWHEGINGLAVMESLGILPSAVAIYLINGRNANPDAALSESDIVSLFPPVGGG